MPAMEGEADGRGTRPAPPHLTQAAQIVFAQVPDPVGGGFVTNQSSQRLHEIRATRDPERRE
jgi:hypothetical protein